MNAWIRFVAVSLGIVSSAVAVAPASAQGTISLTKVVFSLDFIPLGRHAPWYAALAEGYYKDEGLDVSIIPGQGTAQTIQAVEAGTANIGFVDVPSVVLARGNGSKIKMVAVNYRKAPYAIFSLSERRQCHSAQAIRGSEPRQRRRQLDTEDHRGLHGAERPRPEKTDESNVAPPARASTLLAGKIPAIEFFVMAKPGLEVGPRRATPNSGPCCSPTMVLSYTRTALRRPTTISPRTRIP